MTNIVHGMIAGFVATVVLSAMMLIKGAMGVMPGLDPIQMIAGMVGASAAVGWLGHFLIGTIAWGGGFAVLNSVIPTDSQMMKGILFGIAAWLLMMVATMPMAGAGFFGLGIGIMAPVLTLVLHVVFGAVLGGVYARLTTTPVLAR